MTEVQIDTRDGRCRAFVSTPGGRGPWPAVLVYMDGVGIRPAMLALGERLATYGYYVLVPDLYYRSGPYEPMDARTVFADPEKRKVLNERFMSHATPANVMSDTEAFLGFLAGESDATPGPVGTTGYCLGGRMSFVAAATYPDRIAASAAYHPSRLATDAPDSPHLRAPRIRARVYVGGASDDASFPPEQQRKLDEALTAARVDHVVETYPAKHGWVFSDFAVYDPVAAERHWATLTALLDATLGR
jgi:carboxymethylenebutenolidase